MFLASFPAGPWQANCYLAATAEGGECVIVDPGVDAFDGVRSAVVEHGLTPVGVLLTHGHIDHVASATRVADEWGVPAWIHAADRELLTDPVAGLGRSSAGLLAQVLGDVQLREPDDLRLFETGLDVAGLTFEVLHAPGHRPGCVMLSTRLTGHDQLDAVVFSGDVLFAGSIGRTDLPGGDHAVMLDTLRVAVLDLPDTAAILPGHGQQTVMARERATNPYLQANYLGGARTR
ncbi:MAG: MBL fold metallo-hydrolase [Micropruina sp.]|uniref:MBL fold metallo-hydrolase n=1 Tax=Micropruina sp. TaxID=2737536 RepID=UPI0039E2485F